MHRTYEIDPRQIGDMPYFDFLKACPKLNGGRITFLRVFSVRINSLVLTAQLFLRVS